MPAAVKDKNYALKLSYVVYASPDDVFDAVTKEALLEKWCDGGGKVEPVVSGKMEMYDGWVQGEVLSFNKIKKELSYTWKPAEWKKNQKPSVVEFEFNTHPAGTEILVSHKNFPNQSEADEHTTGWVDHFLDPLNDFFT
jgi:uncharacterized protein YndB with AHSA1/START domain